MVCVGGSVAVSSVLAGAPVYTAEAVRYGAACLLLVALARLTGRRILWPRKTEWLWLSGIAVTGLVVFNLALVEGSRHAEPAVLGVAVACVPAVLALIGPLLEGTRPQTAAVAAALVVTAGAGLVQGLGRTDAIGVAWAVAVFGCEAAFTLLAIPVLGRHGPWGVSVHATWLATVMFAVLGIDQRGTARRHEARPGGLARRRLSRGRGHRGSLRAVVFQCPAARGQPGRVAHRDRPGGRGGQRGPARRARRPGRWSGPASRSSRSAWPSASGRGEPNMYFQHDAALWRDFPALVPGVLYAEGITADAAPDTDPYIATAKARLADGPESEFPEIQAWRRAFARMGLKPTQYRCAAESLLRRFRKEGSLPRLHPLVDLCNAVSLAFAVPVAVLDADQVAWPLEVRYASGDEDYLTFGGEVEHPAPGEVIFADQAGQAHARRWTNRQSGRSAVSPATSTVLIVAEALHEGAATTIPELIDALTAEIGSTWPATPQTAVLTPASPRFTPARPSSKSARR